MQGWKFSVSNVRINVIISVKDIFHLNILICDTFLNIFDVILCYHWMKLLYINVEEMFRFFDSELE